MSWNNKEETVITGCRKLGKCNNGVSSHGIMFTPISGETGSLVQELK